MFSNQSKGFEQRVAQVSVRPMRFAFIVERQTTQETLRQIYKYNSSVWGGKFNIFIPSDSDYIRNDWWRILINHDPDFIFLVGKFDTSLINSLYEKVLPLHIFLWDKNDLSFREPDKINPIPVSAIFRKIYTEHRPLTQEDSKIRYPRIDPGIFSNYLEIMTGLYSEESGYVEAIHKRLLASEIVCSPNTLSDYLVLTEEIDKYYTPLKLSGLELKVSFNDFGIGRTGIIISDGSIDDLFLFHILRWSHTAFSGKSTITIVPQAALDSSDGAIVHLAHWITSHLHGNTFSLYSNSIEMNILRELRIKLKDCLPSRGEGWCINIQRCNFDVSVPTVTNLKKDQLVNFGETDLWYEIPVIRFAEYLESGDRWIYEIDLSPSFGNRQGFLPSMFMDLNLLLSNYPHDFMMKGWGSRVRIARGLIAAPATKSDHVGMIKLPTSRVLIETACKNAGFSVERSNNIYYEGILRLIGGIENVEFLTNPNVIKLFSNRKMIQGNAYTFDDMFEKLNVKNEDRTAIYEIVKSLANRDILLRGYNLTCPVCGLLTWYELASIRENMICQGCRSYFQLPVNLDFAFKLNVLFADRNNQGINTLLLTLLLLHKTFRHSLMWQADTVLQFNDHDTEVDIISMCDGVLLTVECKNRLLPDKAKQDNELRKNKIAEIIDQVKRNLEIAHKLKAELFLFATLDEEVPEELTAFLSEQDSKFKNLTIRLVTPKELLTGKFDIKGKEPQEIVFIQEFVKELPYHHGQDCYERDKTCSESFYAF